MSKDFFRTKIEIIDLLELISSADLNVPDGFYDIPIEEIQRIYNGIGAAWQSKASRQFITWRRGFFEPVAVVHDIVGELYNNGTDDGFEQWNTKYWYNNGVKLINYTYGSGFSFMKSLNSVRNYGLYTVLKLCGKKAWKDTFESKLGKGN